MHPRGKELGVYPPSPISYWLRSSFWRCSLPAFPMHGLDTLRWSQEVSVGAAGICSERPSLCTENMERREKGRAASLPHMLQFCNGRQKWDIENTEPCYLWIRPIDFWMLTMYGIWYPTCMGIICRCNHHYPCDRARSISPVLPHRNSSKEVECRWGPCAGDM